MWLLVKFSFVYKNGKQTCSHAFFLPEIETSTILIVILLDILIFGLAVATNSHQVGR